MSKSRVDYTKFHKEGYYALVDRRSHSEANDWRDTPYAPQPRQFLKNHETDMLEKTSWPHTSWHVLATAGARTPKENLTRQANDSRSCPQARVWGGEVEVPRPTSTAHHSLAVAFVYLLRTCARERALGWESSDRLRDEQASSSG